MLRSVCWYSVIDVEGQPLDANFKPKNMILTAFPETSVINQQSALLNIPGERIYYGYMFKAKRWI
jgi:hypothetical protein